MKTTLPRNGRAAIGLTAMLFCSTGHATITVIDYYRLGDADAGAVNGATVNAASQDSVGTKHLTRIGSPASSFWRCRLAMRSNKKTAEIAWT
jgi:hypothetical protein